MSCDLCDTAGGPILYRDENLRVVYVEDADYPGYCRVIWSHHVKEMTDLTQDERGHCMNAVFTVEAVLRELLAPDKINIASLGNFTPHVHWHVIARFRDDAHFPQAIWGGRQRQAQRAAPGDLPWRIGEALAARLKV